MDPREKLTPPEDLFLCQPPILPLNCRTTDTPPHQLCPGLWESKHRCSHLHSSCICHGALALACVCSSSILLLLFLFCSAKDQSQGLACAMEGLWRWVLTEHRITGVNFPVSLPTNIDHVSKFTGTQRGCWWLLEALALSSLFYVFSEMQVLIIWTDTFLRIVEATN